MRSLDIVTYTGQDMKTIERDTDRDNFFGADEAVNYGLVDKVLVSRAESGKVFAPSLPLR